MTRTFSRRAALLTSAMLAVSIPAHAQPALWSLGPAQAVADEGFTRVTAVRELADGRVLVADAGENALYIVTWPAGDVRQLGSEGRGPAEYRSVFGLHELGGDSTLMSDRRNGRYLVLVGGRISSSIDYAVRYRRALPLVTGSDHRGNILISEPTHLQPVAADASIDVRGRADSLLLVRLNVRSGAVDTLERIGGGFRGLAVVRHPQANIVVRNPMAVEEQALLFTDGWIAIAHHAPYRVDWIAPDGRRIRGRALPFDPVPVDDRQRREAVRRRYDPEARLTVSSMPGPWPAVVPPFEDWALLAAPDGSLVIRRRPGTGERGTAFDVVSRTGALARRIVLPEGHDLIGFGRDAAYVLRRDADDTVWLQRHRWP